MRRMLLFAPLAAMALALPACATPGGSPIPGSPSQVCDKSTLDERGGTAVELGYKAFRIAMELAVDSGQLKGQAAANVAALDNQLFSATQAVQSAYASCNAASYGEAIDKANAALAAATAALPKKGN